MRRWHTVWWLTSLSGCRPPSLPLPFSVLYSVYWLEPPPANRQATSHLCHQPVLEEGIGLCDLSLEGRWNARSALPLGTTRLPYNGNQHLLGSGAITSNSASGKHRAPPFFFLYLLLWRGLVALWSTFMWRRRLLVGSVTPLSSSSILSGTGWSFIASVLFCAEELLFGISLLHVR